MDIRKLKRRVHNIYKHTIRWSKDIQNIRIVLGGLIIGLMTFNSWAAFYLNFLFWGLLYLDWTYLPDKDYHKQLFDLMIGTTIASLILLIILNL